MNSGRKKNVVEEPMGIELQTTKQHYIVSPHKDVGNMFSNAFGMSAHKISRNKPPLLPVFANEKQRNDFHKRAKTEISKFGQVTQENRHQYQALEHLVQSSQKGTAKSDLQYVGIGSRVYVQGHGSAGGKSISSDTGQSVSSKTVAKMLNAMKLHEGMEVRSNSCFSGTQSEIKNRQGFIDDFNHGRLHQESGKWSETFAGSLEGEMRKLGMQNKVSGYLGATVQTAQESIGRGHVYEKHMSVNVDSVDFRRSHMRRSGQ